MSHTRDARSHIHQQISSVFGFALLVALLMTTGCATGSSSSTDAGVDGGAADGRPPATCAGTRFCVVNDVYACPAGVPVGPVDSCSDSSCSLGRCVADACAIAEKDRTSFAGCLFYAFEPDNVTTDADLSTSFLVTNPGTTATTAFLERPKPGVPGDAVWAVVVPATIDPGGSARFTVFKSQVSGTGTFSATAIRVRSDAPVTVAAIHSDDTDPGHTFSSSGTMVWPVQSLGSHYRAMTYPQSPSGGVADVGGGLGGAGRIAIIGTQPGTHVRLFPSVPVTSLDSGGVSLDDIELGDGDVFELYSAEDGADLSGTEIIAGFPVAVFSGNVTTSYGRSAPGVHSPDMTHEQLPPLGAWGRSYVAAALTPQSRVCDPLLGPGASLWRVLASSDGTEVWFDPPHRSDLPSSPLPLQAGQVAEIVATGSFAVSASYPVLVTQGMDCEPTLSLATSTDRLLQDFPFAVLPGFDQMIAVARLAGSAVSLDGALLDDRLFQPAGVVFEVAQIDLPACPDSAFVCTHRLTSPSPAFGASLRGMDALSSYALTAPTFRGCVAAGADPDCMQ